MMSIASLMTCLFVVLLMEVFVFKKDFVSPSFLFSASFFMCTVCGYYISIEVWEDAGTIHYKTFLMIIMASILFSVIDSMTRRSARRSFRKEMSISSKPEGLIITDSLLRFTIALEIIGILWTIIYAFQFLREENWNLMMAAYKDVINFTPSELGLSRKLLNQYNKLIISLCYVFLFAYNYAKSNANITKRKKRLYIISFILYILFRLLLSGGRQSSVHFVMAWITCSYLCGSYHATRKALSAQKKKFIKIMFLAIIIIFPMFYFAGRFVGRKESPVLLAATAYLTGGIFGLEQLVAENYIADKGDDYSVGNPDISSFLFAKNHASRYWGEYSFPILRSFGKFLGIIPGYMRVGESSLMPFFRRLGNTVSILGRWYWDFGVWGVFVMLAIVSFLFSYIFYHKIRYTDAYSNRKGFWIIIYVYLVHIVYFAGYDDFFFNLPSMNFALIFSLMWGWYRLLKHKKLKL